MKTKIDAKVNTKVKTNRTNRAKKTTDDIKHIHYKGYAMVCCGMKQLGGSGEDRWYGTRTIAPHAGSTTSSWPPGGCTGVR